MLNERLSTEQEVVVVRFRVGCVRKLKYSEFSNVGNERALKFPTKSGQRSMNHDLGWEIFTCKGKKSIYREILKCEFLRCFAILFHC